MAVVVREKPSRVEAAEHGVTVVIGSSRKRIAVLVVGAAVHGTDLAGIPPISSTVSSTAAVCLVHPLRQNGVVNFLQTIGVSCRHYRWAKFRDDVCTRGAALIGL